MTGVKLLIDWVFDAIYNIFNWYKTNGGVYFYITLIVFFIYPLFTRVMRSLRKH